jgi:hypothetical protein
MRGDYLTADDVADAASALLAALERAGAPDVEIDRHTVTTYSERGPYPAYAVDCTIRGGSSPTVRIVRLDADGTEEPPRILPYDDADALALVILSALTTPKE